MTLRIVFASIALLMTACTSTPTKKESPAITAPVNEASFVERPDMNALQSYLNLDRGYDVLGYTEKSFNTCDTGYGYSRASNCRNLYYIVLQIRLLCRDTEGTISTILTDQDVQPIAGKSIRWGMRNLSGSMMTDGEGYGQIRVIAPMSLRRERVKITSANDFLYMRANEITKVITPRPWCH